MDDGSGQASPATKVENLPKTRKNVYKNKMSRCKTASGRKYFACQRKRNSRNHVARDCCCLYISLEVLTPSGNGGGAFSLSLSLTETSPQNSSGLFSAK